MDSIKKKKWVLLLISLTGGIGLGLLLSFLLLPANQASERRSSNESTLHPPLTNSLSSAELTSVPRDIPEIIGLQSVVDRRLALNQLLEGKDAKQIADLLSHTFTLELAESLFSVQHFLFSELAHVDSEKALELIWETERVRWETLLEIVAIQWSAIAPREALRAFSSLREPWKGNAIKTVLHHQGSLTEAELAEIVESFNITEYFDQRFFESELGKLIDEPKNAFNLVIEADVSDLQKQTALQTITRRWIERESEDNIGSMLRVVRELFTQRSHTLWRPVVDEIVASNPKIAWDQLSSLPEEIQQAFRHVAFRALADEDPINAIRTITSEEYMESMKSEVKYLLITWVNVLSGQVLEHMELVPEDFRSSVARDSVYRVAENLPPSEVLDLLAQFRQLGINTHEATGSFAYIWSRRDPEAAVEWILENMDQDIGIDRWDLSYCLAQLALSDSAKAMEIALKQPVENAVEDDVVLALLREGKIDEGMALLPQVRDSVNPYVYSRVSNFLIEVGRIEDALALGETLEESVRPNFYRLLAWPWLQFNAESLLEELPQMDNVEIRSMIAIGVLQQEEYFSEAELEMIRTFVLDESNPR
ncbi:MAG: hypothetical protein F4Z01_02455 [Gammaproteobacteria bacterium]|nr:hypothetical protein [Gammaproteobacteria bacterium]MYF38638.1 hypothetical protein [Gammaproteobacteria bacterium]